MSEEHVTLGDTLFVFSLIKTQQCSDRNGTLTGVSHLILTKIVLQTLKTTQKQAASEDVCSKAEGGNRVFGQIHDFKVFITVLKTIFIFTVKLVQLLSIL